MKKSKSFDLTERKRMEETKFFLAAIVESFEDSIITVSLDSIITSWNRAAETLYGYPAKEAIGKPLTMLALPENVKKLLADIETIKHSRTVEIFDTVRIHKDGQHLNLEIVLSPVKDAAGQIIGVSTIARDITERKQVEENLRESEERYRTLFTTMDEGFCIIEILFDENDKPIDYRFLEVSPSFEKQTGIKNASGKRMREIAPQHEEHWFEIYGKVALTGESVRFENRAEALHRWYDVYAFRYGQPEYRQVALLFNDITERKQAEESIRFQAHLLNTVEQSVIATDLDGVVIYWNKFAEKLYGWMAEEVMGRSIMELVTPHIMAEQAAEIMSLLRQGKSWTGEFQVQRRNSTTFPAQVFNSPIQDKQGRLVGIVGLSVDITERKQVEEKLRRSEAELRLLTDSIPSLISYVDKTEHYRFVNAVYEEWFKQPREQIIGRTLEDVLGEAYPEVKEYARRALAGETVIFENKLDYPQEQRFVLAQYLPDTDESGEVQGFYAHVTDIGESKRAEAALRESEERLRLLVESASDYAIFTTTLDNRINSWNTGAEIVFGWTESEALGQSVEIIFTPEDRKAGAPEQEIKTALKNGRAPDERFHLRKDGSRFYVSGVMTLLKDGDGNLQGFVKIARDMTERIKAEKAVREKELLQKLVGAQEDERKRIARDLHDELGQKLTALRLKLESIRKACEVEELCGKIDQAQLIAKHIDADIDFLAWELRPAALDDLGLVTALDNYVKEWSRHSGVTAEFHATGLKRMRLKSEIETSFYRITQEALNNTHKHAKAKSVDVMLEKRDGSVVLIIEDNGEGFNPQTRATRSKGLGLIGMYERALLIGGELEIESAPGSGTTIFARVPASYMKKGKAE